MRVLVTGASGFVGRHVVAQLVEGGHDVVAQGRRPPARLGTEAVVAVGCDLHDEDATRAMLQRHRPEGVVHLAWDTTPRQYWTSPANVELVAAGLRLVRLAIDAGCRRIVGAGTCAEYDWSVADHDERATPCRPATLYGASKLALGLMAGQLAALGGVPFAWARYTFVYGPGEQPERLVPSAIRAFRAAEDFPCSDGRQVRDFIHVHDAAAATCALLTSGAIGPVNVGSGEPTSVRHVIETVSGLVGGPGCPRFGERGTGTDEPARLAPVLDRLFDEVGWRPALSLAGGLAQTVAAASP